MRFEIQKDGQSYEVDAPDMQTAIHSLSSYNPGQGSDTSGQDQQQPDQMNHDWSELWGNIGPSAVNTAEGIYNTIRHPVDTASAIAQNPGAAVQSVAEPFVHPRNSMITDPVGSALAYSGLADVAGLGAKAASGIGKAGMSAKAASALSKASEISDLPFQAAKLAAKTPQATGTLFTKLTGTTTASGAAPAVMREAGQVGGTAGEKAGAAIGGKMDTEDLHKMVAKGIEQVNTKALNELNAKYAPLRADKTIWGGVSARLQDALDQVKPIAYSKSGEPKTALAGKVYDEIAGKIQDWIDPPNRLDITKALRASPTGGLAAKIVGPEWVSKVGGNPSFMTTRDFLGRWKQRHSFQNMDDLKRIVEDVYQGYKNEGKVDPMAGRISASVVDNIKSIIHDNTVGKYGNAYLEGQAGFGKLKGLVNQFKKTFGVTEDTQSRRVISINRDNMFTNYGHRVKLLQKMIQHAPAMEGLQHAAAGMSLRGTIPRNLISGGIGVGISALSSGAVVNPMALAWIALHVPRFVGQTAYRMGQAERMIAKPLTVIKGAMDKLNISPHGISVTSGLAGKAANAANTDTNSREQFKNALMQEAQRQGYNIHGDVIDRTVRGLMSSDVDTFMRTLKTVSGHQRLMNMLQSIAGTNGEQK
ncbi:MAG TPA: hypothetical protein VIY48_07090 [Candidatus Paceibacterota bacterium]